MTAQLTAERIRSAKEFPLLIGADPEFFLKKDKNFVSAHGLVKGTKREPFQLTTGAVQLDGTAVEFNITPARTSQEFTRAIDYTLKEIRDSISKDYNFSFSPSAWFDKEYFDKEVPSTSKELGCDPDFDAYKNGAPNPRPNGNVEKDGKVLRTGAGHIHFGWTDGADINSEQHRWDCILLTKNLDRLFSQVETTWDKDTTRRSMYGKPGAYRPKSYGMEYRTLSNAWLNHPITQRFVYDASVFAFRATLLGVEIDHRKTNASDLAYYKRIYADSPENLYNTLRMTIGGGGGGEYIQAPSFYNPIGNGPTLEQQFNLV